MIIKKTPLDGYLFSALIAAALAALCLALRPVLRETDIIMLFLVGAVVTAAWLGRGPAIFYSGLAVSIFNYFFVEPLYTFNVYNSSYWLTFAVMFFASAVISTFAARLREQLIISHQREQHALFLYELTKKLSAAADPQEMASSLLECLSQGLGLAGGVRLAGGGIIGAPPSAGQEKKSYAIRTGAADYGTIEIEAPPRTLEDQQRTLESSASLLGAAIERVLSARAVEDAKLTAEREKVRSTLLSAVSHDLRTPLAAIAGAAETLGQRLKDEPLLLSIRQESARLTRLVTNLLDVTRIESGGIRLNMRAYAPAEIIGSGISASAAALKAHPLSLEVEDNLPFVRMDGLLISQLVQNLLENAARHTPPGTKIELGAYMRENSLCLVVADSGPGIPVGREREIFNKFVTYGQGAAKGAGLGLAICQSIVAAHHGKIYAANKKDGGARFVVELPPDLTLSSVEPQDA